VLDTERENAAASLDRLHALVRPRITAA